MARQRGMEVFSTFCQSHASEVAFHAVAGVAAGDVWCRRARTPTPRDSAVRTQLPRADEDDLVLLNDLLAHSRYRSATP